MIVEYICCEPSGHAGSAGAAASSGDGEDRGSQAAPGGPGLRGWDGDGAHPCRREEQDTEGGSRHWTEGQTKPTGRIHVTKLSSLYSHSYADVTLGLFTKERITFRKPFRIVIRFLIGFVIWTACVHKHCNCRPDHKQDLRTTRYYFVPTVQIDPCMASVRISKMHTHKPRSERALCSQVFRIRLSRRITIQNTFFSVSKAWFEIDLRWPRVKSSFQIRKGSESWSKTAFGTWFIPLWTGPLFYLLFLHSLYPTAMVTTTPEVDWQYLIFWCI